FGVGMRRAQHQGMQRRLRRDVVGVAALAADQRVVFLAADALPDAELDWSSHLVSDCRSDFGRHIAAVRPAAQTAPRSGFAALQRDPGQARKKPRAMPGLFEVWS